MKRLRSDFFDLLIFLLCGFHLGVSLLWIFLNTASVPWDQAGHTRLAIQIVDYFKSFGFLRIVDYFSISDYYPPFVHTIVAFFIIIFGHPVVVSEIVITLFFLASIILVYKYFYELSKNKLTGFLSAAIYSFFPIIFEHSRWFLLEIPLLTFVLGTLYYLNKSDYFTKKRETFWFFLFLALSFATKWTALVYLLIPVSISVYQFLILGKEKRHSSGEFIKKGIMFFLVIVSPWYLINLSPFIAKALIYTQAESSDPANIFTIRNSLFYLYLFINFQVTLALAGLFFIALFYFIASKNKNLFFALAYMGIVYLFFTMVPNKDWRYTIPILPFASYVIADFLTAVTNFKKPLGIFIIIIVLLYQISYCSLLTFRNYFKISYQHAINVPLIGWVDYANLNDNLAHSYNRTIWPQKEILELASKNTLNQDRVWILSIVDQERFNAGNFLLERDLSNFKKVEIEGPPDSNFTSEEDIKNYLSKFNYSVVAKNDVINPATRNFNAFLELKEFIIKDTNWTKIKEFNLPNGDILYLYQLGKL